MTDLTNIPSAEKITANWGERCPDHDPDCFCCQMWAMHDAVERLKRENEHFTKSGIVEIAVRNPSVSDYMNHWEGRALAAESRCDELVKALERLGGMEGFTGSFYVHDNNEGAELKARIDFARSLIQKQKEG